MKKSFILTLLTIITLGLFRPITALAEDQKLPSGTERSQIGQKIQDFVKEHEKTTAAMETVIFDKNGTIYQENFGYMDKEKGIKADDDSVFEWGSAGKLMVWVSVMQLWEEGKVNLEEDIRNYLPEGFLKTLRYDKPITMLDLMNHQAGFEDSSHAYLENKGQNIEQILAINQPAQLYEPGTMTGYSNFSTGLAAYIVERISGQSFADYARKHILQPLGMNKTSLLTGYIDNDYVLEKRKEEMTYDINGKSLGVNYMNIGLYPVGLTASTMGDFQRFAQALLKKEKLFKKSETWEKLFTASSTYPGTDMPLNMHGFWTQEYGTTVVGHGGNSYGFSSYILLDLKNGIGMTIMTNQDHELIYNYEMPALVFGPKKKTDSATFDKFQSGNYRSTRYFASGPMSISRSLFLYTSFVKKSEDNPLLSQDFSVVSGSGDKVKVTTPYASYFRVKDSEILADWAMLIAAVVGIVFSIILFLVRGGLDLFRLVFKKGQPKTPKKLRIWTYLTSLAAVGVVLNFYGLVAAFLASNRSYPYSIWPYIVFAVLGLILAGCAIYPLFSKARKGLGKGRLLLTIMTSLSALAIVANILYWSLYQWWAM